jgi:hypothetical protein
LPPAQSRASRLRPISDRLDSTRTYSIDNLLDPLVRLALLEARGGDGKVGALLAKVDTGKDLLWGLVPRVGDNLCHGGTELVDGHTRIVGAGDGGDGAERVLFGVGGHGGGESAEGRGGEREGGRARDECERGTEDASEELNGGEESRETMEDGG